MPVPSSEKISVLLAKKAKLEARIQRLKSVNVAAERKARNRALLLLGVAMEKHLRKQPGFAQHVRQLVGQHLEEREQEAVFDFLFAPTNESVPSPQSVGDERS